MKTITNSYRDAQVLNLGSEGERGPFLVMQYGIAPNDAQAKQRVFCLRPDGQWVDFNAYACTGRPEAMDEIVFPAMTDVMEAFGRLIGRPRIADLPIDEAGLKAWLARQEGGDPVRAAHAWASQYKQRHGKSPG